MKFRRINDVPARRDSGGYVSRGRPDWLKEWIANLGKWARVSCGHSVDLNDRSLLIIGVFGFDRKNERLAKSRSDILCERCDEFVSVVCPITLMEHMGFQNADAMESTEPLF